MASRTLQVSEKDIRQESRIVWPSFDVCKGRNSSVGNKLFSEVSDLAEAGWHGFEGQQGSAKENAAAPNGTCCAFVYGGLVRSHEFWVRRCPCDIREAMANSRIAESDTPCTKDIQIVQSQRRIICHQIFVKSCQTVSSSPYLAKVFLILA